VDDPEVRLVVLERDDVAQQRYVLEEQEDRQPGDREQQQRAIPAQFRDRPGKTIYLDRHRTSC
jgi:hypothetical protein